MGLNAAVYKRLEELPFTEEDLCFVEIDPRTGEIDFEDANLDRVWRQRVKVVEKRIGNISLVALLRSEIEKILGKSGSVLISKVLYNGVHSGDILAGTDLLPLKLEIVTVREMAGHKGSHDLERFLAAMEELIDASEKHCNPIAFI